MEKKIKHSIIVISIMIVIILNLIIIIKLLEKENEQQIIDSEFEEAEKIKVEDVAIEIGTYRYFYINDVLDKVFNYISQTEENVQNAKALINILDKDYIQKNNITEENVFNVLNTFSGISSYFSKEIYRREISHRQDINGCYYYIKGIIRKDAQEEYIYVLVKQDLKNVTYSISILTEDEFNLKPGENQEITIEPNSYNKIYSKKITEYEKCLGLFNDYINAVENNPEKAYELLNIEYRQKRFGGLENYLEHINGVKNRLSNAILMEYKIEKEEEKTKYICVDQTGNYYIFESTSMMNYDVILDTYTMDLPIFIERYNSANIMMRGKYNIERCFEAINNKDYAYVYNKLNEVFKNNNYKTQEEFIQALKNNIFDSNKIEISYNNNEGEIYIYNLKITDEVNSENTKNMEIIMKLNDATNFEMSFSFEE